MMDVTSDNYAEQQLLGEIATRVVGLRHQTAQPTPGEQVFLEREPNNAHDRHAVRVVNQDDQPAGYVPRAVAAWLAPLLDSGKLRVEAYLPAAAKLDDQGDDGRPRTLPLTLVVFLQPEGRHLLERTEVRSAPDALHELFRQAYHNAQSYTDANVILELARRLRPLTNQQLLPETRLLLELIPGIAREARVARSFQAMVAFQELLSRITVGKPLRHSSLSIFPLAWPEAEEPPYVLLRDAIDRGEAEVTEIDEHGSVPSLMLINRGRRPILVLEGEILVGVKQNRVVNITLLVAAQSKLNVPVSCVEQGRWRSRSRAGRADFFAPSSLRRRKIKSVYANRAARGTSESDQCEVWDDVEDCLFSLGVDSETASLTDGLTAAEARLREYREHLPLPKGTAGVVVALGEHILGMDLFDSSNTLKAVWHRLGDAYFFEAIRSKNRRYETRREAVREFLSQVRTWAKPSMPTVGLGHGLEILDEPLVGSGLIHFDRICHLSAFRDPHVDNDTQANRPG